MTGKPRSIPHVLGVTHLKHSTHPYKAACGIGYSLPGGLCLTALLDTVTCRLCRRISGMMGSTTEREE